jgi:hypothetical protein
MQYGGWADVAGTCPTACDGMATPGDPGWHLETDAHGCKVWKEPASPAHRCGEPPTPSDPDAG